MPKLVSLNVFGGENFITFQALNFPLLPVGSTVQIETTLNEVEIDLEGLTITGYFLSNTHGVRIHLDSESASSGWKAAWECADLGETPDYRAWPKVINFK